MGTRQSEQASLWIATAELPKSPGHPFYTRLNALLAPPTSIGSSKAQEQSQPSLRSVNWHPSGRAAHQYHRL